jgi:hypothetical protein
MVGRSARGFPDAPSSWEIYRRAPGLVLGFHGCDRSIGEDLLGGRLRHLHQSSNEYDWLGSGIYFWEADPWRARSFARKVLGNPAMSRGTVTDPYVVGAVIDLGLCVNLLDVLSIDEVRMANDFLEAVEQAIPGVTLPENRGKGLALRYRDKAVIEQVHKQRSKRGYPSYDTVRAAFIEGEPAFKGSGINLKNHIQIAVRNLEAIKGYFRLPDQ